MCLYEVLKRLEEDGMQVRVEYSEVNEMGRVE